MRNLSEELLSKFIHFESIEDKNTYSYQFVTDIPLVKPLDGMENQENPYFLFFTVSPLQFKLVNSLIFKFGFFDCL